MTSDLEGVTDAEPQITDFDLSSQIRDIRREITAHGIASQLMLTFRIALMLVLVLGFAALIYEQARNAHPPTESFIKDSLLPFLGGVGTFGTTLFGPLLAFVLGHYFGQRTQS